MTSQHAGQSQGALGNEHAELRSLVQRVQQAIARRQGTRQEVSSAVSQLTEHLLEHFQHEEDGGYFNEALDVAPRLRDRATALLGEHTLLRSQLVLLREAAGKTSATEAYWSAMETVYHKFLALFSVHEAAENALVQEALNDDIGTKD